jgi:hypothetical protein
MEEESLCLKMHMTCRRRNRNVVGKAQRHGLEFSIPYMQGIFENQYEKLFTGIAAKFFFLTPKRKEP